MKTTKSIVQMQVLKSLEYRFNNQTTRIKIELFLIPILLLVLYFSYTYNLKEKSQNINGDISSKTAFKSIKINMINVLKDIEEFSKQNKIQILNISNTNDSLEVIVKTDIKNQFEFLIYLENYNNYSFIQTLEQNSKELKIMLTFKNLYVKKDIDISKKLESLRKQHKQKFKLLAIVDNSALINNEWIDIGQNVNLDFILDSIEGNRVFLLSKEKVIELEL